MNNVPKAGSHKLGRSKTDVGERSRAGCGAAHVFDFSFVPGGGGGVTKPPDYLAPETAKHSCV